MYCFFNGQVEPNARKIEEHRRKYDRLRKQKQQKGDPIKTEASVKKEQETEAQVSIDIFSVIERSIWKLGFAVCYEALIFQK